MWGFIVLSLGVMEESGTFLASTWHGLHRHCQPGNTPEPRHSDIWWGSIHISKVHSVCSQSFSWRGWLTQQDPKPSPLCHIVTSILPSHDQGILANQTLLIRTFTFQGLRRQPPEAKGRPDSLWNASWFFATQSYLCLPVSSQGLPMPIRNVFVW